MTTRIPYKTALHWLVLVAAIGFGALVLWQHGALATLVAGDPSHISLAVLGLFVLTSVHAGGRALSVSRELNAVSEIRARLAVSGTTVRLDGQSAARLYIGAEPLADCMLTRHARARLGMSADGMGAAPLYAALERDLLGAHEIGWLLSDLMVKLGLLGTVLGFIVMLGAVDTAQDLDIAAMRNILLDMSGGMRIALYTTLTGLTAGVLLGLQYHVVERGAEDLLGELARVTESMLAARAPAAASAASEAPAMAQAADR